MSYFTSVSRKIAGKAVSRLKKYVRPLLPVDTITTETFDLILRAGTAGDIDIFTSRASARFRIIPELQPALIRRRLAAEFSGSLNLLQEKADACARNHFAELGSQYVNLDDGFGGVRWLKDFKSDVTWPDSHYLKVPIILSDNQSDIKTIWELSRFQFATALAQMEVLTGDERYRQTFITLVDDWQRKNPYPQGPNWTCAMEVAIRAINILLAVELFHHTRPLPAPFLKTLYTLLYQSGRHIFANLEDSGRGLNTNHYLADLIGLLTLGALFDCLEEGREWLHFAVTELEIEIREQTTDDGFCYESSANYHLLTLEFYLYTLTFCRSNDIALSVPFVRALQKALDITSALRDTTGVLPNIGDNDSGRLLKLSHREDRDPEWLLFWGLMEGLAAEEFTPRSCATAESLWLFGGRRLQSGRLQGDSDLAQNKQSASNAYHTSSSQYLKGAGIVKMAHDDLSLMINVADIGVNGLGGHKHNDQLSLALSWGAKQFIIDPGTLTYTANETERNRLRSVESHSTAYIDGAETNRFLPGYLFSLRKDGAPQVTSWLSTRELDLLQVEHNCYQRLSGAPIIKRAVYFDKLARFWLVRDQLCFAKNQTPGKYAAKWRLASTLITEEMPVIQNSAQISYSISNDKHTGSVTSTKKSAEIASEIEREFVIRRFSPGGDVTAEPFVYAPGYGVAAKGHKTMLYASSGVTELIWGIFPNLGDEQKQNSKAMLQAKFDLLEWRNVFFDMHNPQSSDLALETTSSQNQDSIACRH